MNVPTVFQGGVSATAFCAAAALLVLAMATGCSRRPEVAPVSGRVTLTGRPLGPGTILFMPQQAQGAGGKSAAGRFGPDGRYTLGTFVEGDGAIVGRHRVMLTEAYSEDGHEARSQKPIIPAVYSNPKSTPLTAEVTSGRNEINFDLTPSPSTKP